MPEFRLATARAGIDLEAGLELAGYAARRGTSVGVLDPLELTVIALTDAAGGSVAWVGLDTVAVTAGLADRIRAVVADQLSLPPERVICAATHTHASPVGWVGQIHPMLPGEVDEGLVRRLLEVVAQTAGRCHWAPVDLAWSDAEVQSVGANRHDPDGPVDRSLGVLSMWHGGELAALMVDYACHPTVLGPENLRWSGDWVSGMRAALRRSAPDLPVLFLQGSAGDTSTRFTRRARTKAESDRLGAEVAAAVEGSLDHRTPLAGPIQVSRRQLPLPVRDTGVPGPPAATGSGSAAWHVPGIGPCLPAEHVPSQVSFDLSGVRIGDRAWLHHPTELAAELGIGLRTSRPGLRVVGYSDGYAGYIATPAAHREAHYEACASFLDSEHSAEFLRACADYVASW